MYRSKCSEICLKSRSIPALLSFKLVTEHRTVKWFYCSTPQKQELGVDTCKISSWHDGVNFSVIILAVLILVQHRTPSDGCSIGQIHLLQILSKDLSGSDRPLIISNFVFWGFVL